MVSVLLEFQKIYFIKIIKTFSKAIVSTSANISGKESPKQFLDISNHIKNNVDYIVNLRKNENGKTIFYN